jgi:hypothetical protein
MVGGLPTYTPAQLHLVNPAIKYKNYFNFISNRRGLQPGPAWPGRGGPGLPTIESLIRNVHIDTPAMIQARTNQMTADQVKAQQGLVYDEATRARAQALRTMQAQAAAGNAAAAMNKDLFGMVGGQYNAGAQELAGLATGGVSDLTDQTAANTAAVNASLASVGMPGIDARMAGPEQASVARFRAGLGAQDMLTQGSAANFGLAGLINSQDLRATQEAVAGQNVSNTAIEQKQSDAIAEIARTRPDVAAKILAQLQDANRQQIALGSSLLQQRRAALQTGFQQGMTKKQFALSKKQLKQQKTIADAQIKAASAKLANQNAMPDATLSGKLGYLVDANGNPLLNKAGKPVLLPTYKVDKNGRVVKAAGAGTGGAGAATPGEVQTFLKTLAPKAPATQSTTKRNTGTGTSVTTRQPSGAPVFPVKFTAAYKRLLAMGVDDASARGYLDSIYKRGEGGRDWLRNEEQAILQRAAAATRGQALGVAVRPTSHVYKGVHYLDRPQMSALTKENVNVPGHWMQGSTSTQDLGPIYVIDQTYD